MNYPAGFKSFLALLVAAGLGACVTINIYFPAAAAEKAADKIIDEVWQLKEGAKEKPRTPASAPASGQQQQ
jgi:hypothetical protein